MMRSSKPALSSQSFQGIYYLANASVWQPLPSCPVKVIQEMFRLSPVEEVDLC